MNAPTSDFCPTPSPAAKLVRVAGLLLALATAASLAFAQVRPTPLPGGGGGNAGGGANPGGGGGVIISPPIGTLPGGGGGGGIIVPPIVIGGGGGGNLTTDPAIIVPSGALVGATVSATATLGQAAQADSATATYQWSITGGRLIGEGRSATTTFVADTPGTVSLFVTIGALGTTFSPSATVTVLSAELAGAVTTPPSVAASATSVTATVPAAQRGDRTFRWSVTGGATIVSGQGTNSITYRPGAPGLKQIVCAVSLQNVVTVPVRAYVVALGTGESVAVTVNNGSGGGTYPAGTRVDVVAHPPSAGEVFDRWIGDTAVLGTGPLAALVPHTSFTVPASAITLTATYKSAPAWTPTVIENFNPQTQTGANNTTTTVSTTLLYHASAEAAGLVFLLHDTGSSAREWFDRPNQFLLARELVAAGFGVAALDSINRTAGSWAAPAVLANNLDALNHVAALDRLVALGAVSADKPIFFVGRGAGANSAIRYADLIATGTPARPVKGAVLFLAAGIDTLNVTSRVPQLFALAANDETLGAAGLQEARDANQMLLGRGVATGMLTNTVAPLYPDRLRTLALTSPTFTADDAQAVWNALKSADLLDDNSYPKGSPSLAAVTAALPAAYRSRAADVAAEIAIAAAGGEFYSDANVRVIDFLTNRAANAPVPPPGRLVNLSTRGNVAYLGDSLTVGFTLAGTTRATLLIRAIGPALTRFGVGSALIAPRLEVNRGTSQIAANEGWDKPGNPASAAQLRQAAAGVGAFALTAGALDSAVLLQLEPGSYAATVEGIGGAVGEVLVEVYDVSRNATRLTNLSTLSRIASEGDLLIPGIVVSGANPRALMVRAVSQGLRNFGLGEQELLGDPRISVLNGNTVVSANNNWAQTAGGTLTAAFPAVGAFPLSNAADAALLESLAPGSYTLQAGATPLAANLPDGTVVPSQTGAVLVEVYEVP